MVARWPLSAGGPRRRSRERDGRPSFEGLRPRRHVARRPGRAPLIRAGRSGTFLDEDAAAAARVLRGEWVRIEGAGHTVQGDRPYDTANALRAFLDGHTIRPSAERGR